MQLRQLHHNFLAELKLLYNEHEAAVIAAMVFETVLGIDKMGLAKDGGTEVSHASNLVMNAALEQLRQHVPVQYVTGIAWFYNLAFEVNSSVLVPRPETEELVKHVISYSLQNAAKTLIDIGTGSGCIPVSLKKNLPGLKVTALDISPEALATAKKNAKKHDVEIEWKQIDFLDRQAWEALPTYDVIVSNPPYIPAMEAKDMDKNVIAHEPHLALFVPDNAPLVFYDKIAEFGIEHLANGGHIFMETHEKYAQQVAELFRRCGYVARVEKDFYEKERMVFATRSHSQ